MPQLDQFTYFTQFFWLCLFFFTFYILICNDRYGVLGISRILKLRNQLLSHRGNNIQSKDPKSLEDILRKGFHTGVSYMYSSLFEVSQWCKAADLFGKRKKISLFFMTRKRNPISVRLDLNRSSNWFLVRVEVLSQKFSFFLDVLWSLLKRTKDSVYSFCVKNNFLFFVRIGYITFFFCVFSLSYSRLFPTMEGPNYTRPFQVILQLSLYLFYFRLFTTKEEKEAKWLLLISAFFSVVTTLFLKNLVSLEGLLFIVVPLFSFLILLLPSDVLPFAILLFYSLEKGLAQWAFFLLFQLIAYYSLCFFLEARPKQSICPFILLFFYFFFVGKVLYSADFLHEPARLTALVSGACIIFLCIKSRSRLGICFSFLIYLISSTTIGVISIATAPGGENISCPIPFLFILCHFFLFLGFLLFQRNIPAARQPLVPLLFGALLYFLPYFPNLEWLEGWIEGLDLFLLLLGFVLVICGEESE